MKTYCTIRFFQEDGKQAEILQTGLSLEEARAYVNSPNTSGPGWFDGYAEEYQG